ncbi:hypothetical protein MATL_G00074770 [Megalops atlanticus]|uniref:Uncharacterized protein n=1 Tax=Megalops atlanticus TaxID=7932 RepID=A0A9D3QAF9_MEGAT|nr:hypothetical protein MATL_G00074770 [Megalops atlanticus]
MASPPPCPSPGAAGPCTQRSPLPHAAASPKVRPGLTLPSNTGVMVADPLRNTEGPSPGRPPEGAAASQPEQIPDSTRPQGSPLIAGPTEALDLNQHPAPLKNPTPPISSPPPAPTMPSPIPVPPTSSPLPVPAPAPPHAFPAAPADTPGGPPTTVTVPSAPEDQNPPAGADTGLPAPSNVPETTGLAVSVQSEAPRQEGPPGEAAVSVQSETPLQEGPPVETAGNEPVPQNDQGAVPERAKGPGRRASRAEKEPEEGGESAENGQRKRATRPGSSSAITTAGKDTNSSASPTQAKRRKSK